MKILMYVLILSMLAVPTFARTEVFYSPVNISIDNGIVKIVTEDKQVRTYSVSNNLTDVITVTLVRETACREEQLYDFLEGNYGQTTELNTCNTNLDACVAERNNLQKQATVNGTSYKEQYEKCISSGVQNQCSVNSPQCQSAITSAETRAREKESAMKWYFVIGAGIVVYLLMKRQLGPSQTQGMQMMR